MRIGQREITLTGAHSFLAENIGYFEIIDMPIDVNSPSRRLCIVHSGTGKALPYIIRKIPGRSYYIGIRTDPKRILTEDDIYILASEKLLILITTILDIEYKTTLEDDQPH